MPRQDPKEGYKLDWCMINNLTWPRLYLRSALSNYLLQKVPTIVPLTATVTEVCAITTTAILPDSYKYLDETPNNLRSLEIKKYPGENVADFSIKILVGAERLQSSRAFNPKNFFYTPCIFEDTSDCRLRFCTIHRYK